MKTSNFANNQRYNLNGISISRHPAVRNGFKGPEFPPLMPSAQLLNGYKDGRISWPGYIDCYQTQLDCLNPKAVWQQLHDLAVIAGADEPVLLCFESAKTLDSNPCHRRLVAGWLAEALDEDIPEWGGLQLGLLEAA